MGLEGHTFIFKKKQWNKTFLVETRLKQDKALLLVMNGRHHHRYKILMTFEHHQQQEWTNNHR